MRTTTCCPLPVGGGPRFFFASTEWRSIRTLVADLILAAKLRTRAVLPWGCCGDAHRCAAARFSRTEVSNLDDRSRRANNRVAAAQAVYTNDPLLIAGVGPLVRIVGHLHGVFIFAHQRVLAHGR